jgi:hypothetical protein
MNGATMVLARYYAKQLVKHQIRRHGLRPHEVSARLIHQAADAYLDQHRDELIARATTQYRSFVESSVLRPERIRRKPSQ